MSADLFQTFGLAEMRNLAVSDCIIGLISELMSGQRRTLRLMSLLCNGMLHVWNARSISLNSSSREIEYFVTVNHYMRHCLRCVTTTACW